MKIIRETTNVVIKKTADQGPPGPEGPPGVSTGDLIDDLQVLSNRTYSSGKIEDRLTEEGTARDDLVGDANADFVIHFENILSQGA